MLKSKINLNKSGANKAMYVLCTDKNNYLQKVSEVCLQNATRNLPTLQYLNVSLPLDLFALCRKGHSL